MPRYRALLQLKAMSKKIISLISQYEIPSEAILPNRGEFMVLITEARLVLSIVLPQMQVWSDSAVGQLRVTSNLSLFLHFIMRRQRGMWQ